MDITKDIERWTDINMTLEIEGKKIEAKGRANFFYKGQPYYCKNCLEQHNDKCPQVVTKKLAEQEAE